MTTWSTYLTEYARQFALPVMLGSRVRSVRQAEGRYLVEVDGRSYTADQVVVATGPFQVPFVPAIAEQLGQDVFQLHSTRYRAPGDLPDGRVLVVGGGNTGFQIAEELSATREVHLSIGSRQTPLPQRILGRDLFWYLEKIGAMRKSTDTRIGRRLAGRDTLIGSNPRTLRKRHGVRLHPRAVEGFRAHGPLQRRKRAGRGRRDLGHRLPQRSLMDRRADLRRPAPRRSPPRGDRLPWPVLPRIDVAVHQRLGADRLGRRRRRVHRRSDQDLPHRPTAARDGRARRRAMTHQEI